ncbi:SMP-30/gluconolactonase/LRE family protein [Silvibacterium dinghuense]|uniref:Gluconolaconase n=1 Tax=Silvibacterium dinghuense TaxID=1560006 RepID=A0A4Q1SBD6_9BACT|nr:gluconolaconase [Silvibacterium dinghuense]RXS94454.1 gluconolaconase [Silvibacterium dinghuense]
MAPLIKTDFGGAPRIESVQPDVALPGGEVEIHGANLGPVTAPASGTSVSWRRPVAMLGELAAPVVMSRSRRLVLRVPDEAESGKLRILQNGAQSNQVDLSVASLVATGIHAVASPAVDEAGNIYVTLSGSRGQETPVSVYRVEQDGEMRPFLSGIMNATGLAMGPDGYLYVSSRNDGTVYRVTHSGAASVYAEGMGVATGMAFDGEGNLYVGDRSGTIFKIAPDRQIFVFSTLEPSVAAYHLAFGIDGTLYVAGPTTSSHDAVYAIDQDGATTVFYRGLGRPQGLAVDVAGAVYVAGSLGGRRGVVRIGPGEEDPALVISGSGIVGFTFVPGGSALVATGSSVYHVPLGVEGWRIF